jgi:DNA-binding PucR family transcriptional regulator
VSTVIHAVELHEDLERLALAGEGGTVLGGDIGAERARIRTRLAGIVGDGRVRAVTGSPPARLREYVQRELGALADRPELLATLAAGLDTGRNRVAVAERLGIHRNSVGYRMDRVRSLLGDPVASPASCTARHVALDALDVLHAHEDSDHG